MSDSPNGFGVLTVLLRTSPKPTLSPTPTPTSDTGLLIALIVIIVLLAVGVVALLLRLRRPRGETPIRLEYESARRSSSAEDKAAELDARKAELDARTAGLNRRRSSDAGVALDQRDVLAETCMDVADLAENDALADRLRLGLRRAGYEILAPNGGRFDPEVHEVFERRPTDDPALDRVVAATMRPGYRLDGQTVRYAKVVVYGVDRRSASRG